MKVLVIGAEGQLGQALTEVCSDLELYRADLRDAEYQVDISDPASVERLFQQVAPSFVFNTAATHDLPRCEQRPALAFAVNAMGPRYLAAACRRTGARFVHVSTDYVFDGKRNPESPYVESDMPAPMSVYAASKLAGEHLVAAEHEEALIVRTAALYGRAPNRSHGGRNFVELMLHLAETRRELRLVADEMTSPTYTDALAKQLRWLAEKGRPGLYHATCQGACSWYEFARAIFEETGQEAKVVAATRSESQAAVRHPAYSVLDNRHAKEQGLDIMPHWRDALKMYLKTLAA